MRLRTLALLLALTVPAVAPGGAAGFSVLAHQAVVDRNWDAVIAPRVARRFPGADLERARAFAYGGSHVADLGYFPLGSALFTELLHYVRTGDLVTNLIAAARDANEYAFALGALAHFVGDTTGHPEATNRVVPVLYPELRAEHGDRVTYADDASAHLQTELRFDVLQMARTRGGRDVMHHAVQFEVATRVLDEALRRTYGLALDDLFASPETAILTYRWAFRGLVHEATGIAWELYRSDIQGLDPAMTAERFVYDLSRADFEREFGTGFDAPGIVARTLGFFVNLLPDVGPLERAIWKPLPPDARARFVAALDQAVARYRTLLAEIGDDGRGTLRSANLDTGTATRFGEYPPADEAYARLVATLAERPADRVPAALRADLRRFYATRPAGAPADDDARALDTALAAVLRGPA